MRPWGAWRSCSASGWSPTCLGLDLLGVDMLVSESGPVVVDVSDFPGYRGVNDEPELVAEHLLSSLAGRS